MALVLLMIVFTVPMLTAQGSSDSSGTVELRWSFWGGDARFAKYEEIANRYMAAHPDVKIVREPMSWNDYWTKIPTQVAAGAAPDLMQMHARYVKNFTQSDALLDLKGVIDAGNIDLSNFTQAGIQTGIVDGKNVMIDIGLVTTGLTYNETLASKYGISIPEDTWSWSDFEAFLISATGKLGPGLYAAGDDSMVMTTNTTPFTIYMRSRGKDMYTEDGQLGFTKADLTDWFSMWDRLRKADAVPSAAISSEESAKTWEQTIFVKGEQLVSFMAANRLRIYQEQMPGMNLEMQRTPKTGGNGGEFLEGAHMAINARTKHSEAAADFINFFVNSEESLEIYIAENGWPASTEMNEFIQPLLSPVEQEGAALVAKVAGDAELKSYIMPPSANTEISRLMDREAQAIGFGTKSITKAVDDFFAAAKDLL